MSTDTYILTYFNIRGLAEVPRLLFKVSNVPFEDDRIAFDKKEDGSFFRGKWEDDNYKKTFPFRQVPVLTVNGKVQIAQSSAINRFLSKRFGLFGENDIDAALIDAVGEQLTDVRKSWYTEKTKDGAQPGEHLKKFFDTTFPEQLSILETNVHGNGHFVGSKLSLADVQFYYLVFVFGTENKDLAASLSKYPKLKQVHDNVANNANIKKWVGERPQTIF